MITKISHITLLVHDQEEALQFYTEKLGFEKRDDNTFQPGMRWLTVSPSSQREFQIVLMLAQTDEQKARIGSPVADHVLFAMLTDDIQKTYTDLVAQGVHFRSQPEKQFYGTDAVFEDLYGNRIDLVELPK